MHNPIVSSSTEHQLGFVASAVQPSDVHAGDGFLDVSGVVDGQDEGGCEKVVHGVAPSGELVPSCCFVSADAASLEVGMEHREAGRPILEANETNLGVTAGCKANVCSISCGHDSGGSSAAVGGT